MTKKSAHDLAAAYYESWAAKDFGRFRSLLADDVTFRGPLGTADDIDSCVAGVQGMSKIVTDVVVAKILADENDALCWFDLHTSVAEPCPTASWIHVEDGRITSIRATFDPRSFGPPPG